MEEYPPSEEALQAYKKAILEDPVMINLRSEYDSARRHLFCHLDNPHWGLSVSPNVNVRIKYIEREMEARIEQIKRFYLPNQRQRTWNI